MIMVILVGLVVQITSEVLKVWNRSSGKLAANAEARIAMDLITQDLETAVFRNNGQQWLLLDGAAGVGPYDGQTISVKMFSPALDRDQSSPGDICAIGYQLAFTEAYANSPDKVYALYRKIVAPDVTFGKLMGSRSEGSGSPQLELTGDDWDDITDDGNYLASNITEFKVILYVDDGNDKAEAVNWDEGQHDLTNGTFAYGGNAGTLVTRPLLYADVFLTIVTDEGFKLLQLLDSGVGGTGYSDAEEVVREHGEIYTRRVNFLARPL